MSLQSALFTYCASPVQGKALQCLLPSLRAAGVRVTVGVTPRVAAGPVSPLLEAADIQPVDLETGLEARVAENVARYVPPLLMCDIVDVAVAAARPRVEAAGAVLLLDGGRVSMGLAKLAHAAGKPVIAQQCRLESLSHCDPLPSPVPFWRSVSRAVGWRPADVAERAAQFLKLPEGFASLRADRYLLAGAMDVDRMAFLYGVPRRRMRAVGLPGVVTASAKDASPGGTILFADDAPVRKGMMPFNDWMTDIVPFLQVLSLFQPLYKFHPEEVADIENMVRDGFAVAFDFLDRAPLTDADLNGVGLVVTGTSTLAAVALARGIPVVSYRLPHLPWRLPEIAHPGFRVAETPEALRECLTAFQNTGALPGAAPREGVRLEEILAPGDAAAALCDALAAVRRTGGTSA